MKAEKPILGYDQFLMMALLKEGPLSLEELWEKSILFISLIWYQQLPEKSHPLMEKLFFKLARLRSRLEDGRENKKIQATNVECEKLIKKGWVELNKDNKYELNEEGQKKAKIYTKNMEREASTVKNGLLKPSATARNTTFLDFFLAILKLGAGFLSGSVGLISDGVDNTMDTVSAFLVWLGIKYQRENLATFLVIVGLFGASYAIGSESFSHVLRAMNGTLEPLTMPYLVIAVEGVVLLVVGFLFYYQRYVGRAFANLTLIAQSVDNKNHVFIAISVIVGAVFAIYGIYFVDAIIGFIIAVGIFVDAVGLLREAISSRKGKKEDYSQYKLPLEKCWQENKLVAFRNWILYVMWAENLKTPEEIVPSLHKAFHPKNYIPVLSELNATCSESYDFEGNFKGLIEPLMEQKLLVRKDEEYNLTERGRKHLETFISNFSYYDVHLSDTILLAMAKDVKKYHQ